MKRFFLLGIGGEKKKMVLLLALLSLGKIGCEKIRVFREEEKIGCKSFSNRSAKLNSFSFLSHLGVVFLFRVPPPELDLFPQQRKMGFMR